MINYKEKSDTRPWVPSYDRRKKNPYEYLSPSSEVETQTMGLLKALMFSVWIFLGFYFGTEFFL